jgi:plastocyanin
MPRRLTILSVAALLALASAACGDDDAADTTAAPTTTAAATTTTAAATTTTAAATTTTAAATTTTAAATTTAAGGDGGEAVELEIVIQGDRFSEKEIVVPAGQEISITVIDKDTETDAPHNFHIRTPDADFFTNIEEAPNTQVLTFQIDTPGEYQFFCDTHAVTMNGVVLVQG